MLWFWRNAACAVAISLLVPLAARAAPSVFEEYTLTTWSDEDGLFGGWIVGIAQDAQGYLWVGTVSGLLRFDGLRFERFKPREGDQLPQRSVASVFAARDGSLWVGFSGSGGVCQIRDGRVIDYGPEDGFSDGRVTAIVEDADGVVLAATAGGLFRFLDGRWVRVSEAQGLPTGPVHSLFLDREGTMWAATADALYRRDRRSDTFTFSHAMKHRALSLSESPKGTFWTTDADYGYAALDAKAPGSSESMRATGYRLLHDHQGHLWVATLGQGLWFVPDRNEPPQVIGAYNGLSNNTVRTLFEDSNGDVWVGTTAGLHRFARRRVGPITDLGMVMSVTSDRERGVWVGTSSGLVHVTPSGRRRYGISDGLPNSQVRALHLDPAGRLWMGTEAGVAVMADGRITTLPLEEGSWPIGVMSITVAPSGDLLICTQDHGLFRWAAGRITPATFDGGAKPADSVFTDSQGRVWLVLAGGGIGLYDQHGSFRVLRRGDRFHRSELAIHEDPDGAVYFGGGGRLTRFKDGTLSAITSKEGLPPDTIRAIVGDSQGHLWIGTSGGILRLGSAQFDRVLAGTGARLDFRAYNSSDGLAGAPVRSGYPNATLGSDGRLWFVTANGLTALDPQRLAATRPAPAVRIERVSAGGRSFEPDGAFTLPPRTTALQIEYTALEFFSPRQVQFRYRLEGFDDEWVDVGERRLVSFTNLPPRRYRFHVIARSSEGVWNDHGGVVDFSIAPTFYQTRWFTASCVLGVVGLVLIGWRARLRQVRRQFGLVLTERARMAREIHDTLLQSLAGLELQVDAMATQIDSSPDAVKQQLDRVRRQIQLDVTEARQSIWDLRSPALEANDLASALRDLGEVVAASGNARFEFVLRGEPVPCSHKIEEHLLRVGREAVSNAVRHAQAQVVRLELSYEGDAIALRVSDDGRGFDPQDIARLPGGHWGMATMQERAQAIGGHLRLVSRPGAGTNLEMIAPLLTP